MGLIACSLCSRRDLLLEILALRQQLTVLKGRRCQPRLTTPDRVFWVMLRRFWSGWKRTLVIVQPEQSLVGIEPVSSCIGRGARGIRLAQAGSA